MIVMYNATPRKLLHTAKHILGESADAALLPEFTKKETSYKPTKKTWAQGKSVTEDGNSRTLKVKVVWDSGEEKQEAAKCLPVSYVY